MMKTELNFRTLAEKGLFLKERLQKGLNPFMFIENEESEKSIHTTYQLWQKKAGGNGGEQAFLKRLAVEDITPERAKAILAPVSWKEDSPLPEWVQHIENVLSLLPVSTEAYEGKLFYQPPEVSVDEFVYVGKALIPFIYNAEQQALASMGDSKAFFTDKALSEMSKRLTNSLNKLCAKTCKAEFEQWMNQKYSFYQFLGNVVPREKKKAKWNDFLEELLTGKWEDIFAKYPVLARIMSTVTIYWINHLVEFAHHVKSDLPELEETFHQGKKLGRIEHIEADISDMHNQGKSVFILTFSSGIKIVYKPRSMQIDCAWQNWIHYMEQNGLPYDLLTPKVIDKKTYGWMEFIEHVPLVHQEEAHKFFFRAGVLLGMVYAIGGNDFHYENIIACGTHPVLVDTETLLSHKVKPFKWDEHKMSARQIATDILSDSVVRTGMLPLWFANKDGEAVDGGALTSKEDGYHNLPVYQGVSIDVMNYQEDLIEGVKWVFSFLMNNKEQILTESSPLATLFEDCLFRFLIRNSQVYADILSHTTKPKFLKDGILYSMEIERIASAYLLYAPDDKHKELWNIFISERDALESRDIPIFYGKAKEFTIRDGVRPLYEGYFMENAIENAKNLIAKLDEKEQSFQLDLIKTSLSMIENVSHEAKVMTTYRLNKTKKIPVTDELLLSEAMGIYDDILDKSIRGQDDDFTWIVRQFDLKTDKLTLGQINFSLYDGVTGIGVFMAALYHLTQKEEIKETTLATIQSLRNSLSDSYNPLPIHRFPLGIGSGVAGFIRAFTWMGKYLQDDSLLEDAVDMAKRIQPEQIEEDKQLDILGGTAGLLTVLIDLYNETGEQELLALAQRCGEHLLKKRRKAKTGHHVWTIGIEKQPLTGMGHGAAGYAVALYSLAKMTENEVFQEAALEAIDYENSFYDAAYRNWPDFRKNRYKNVDTEKAFMMGWCSGAPGIGLARIKMLESHHETATDQGLTEDIEKAIQFTCSLHDEGLKLTDHICCGNTGGIDLLIEAALHLKNPSLLREARKQMGMLIERKKKYGHFILNGSDHGAIFNPSFFQGVSGIGYQMLRLIAPEKISSLLK